MESYSFKPKLNQFPKIISSNSTWYKTFNLEKTKNNSMKDLNVPNLLNNNNNQSNNINNNRKSNKNIIFQKKNSNNNSSRISQKISKSKLSKNSRPSSVIQYRNLEEETDDSIFALSQITNIDHLISKRINKNLVWKEKPKKVYDMIASRNYKDIKRIRQKIHETRFEPSRNFDLRTEIDKKKYCPIEKVDIINDASDIMKKMENQINDKKINNFFIKKRVDIQTFAKQNRDICLKNNIINLIKNESNNLKVKEQEISKALEEANISFNKDKKLFEKFLLTNKDKLRQDELIVENAIKHNKNLVEQIHKLNSEIRSRQDEIERTIRNISIYHSYAEFIHRIIGNVKPLKKINKEKLNILQMKNEGKDLKFIANSCFEQFDFLLNDNHITKTNDFKFDAEQLSYLFNSMENSIIKLMNERDNILREIIKEKHNSEILFLKNRIFEHEKELNYLKREMNLYNLNDPINEECKNKLFEGQKYIFEIYTELNNIFGSGEIRNTNINMEIISRETINFLHKLEDKLLFYINEMEKIRGNEKEPDEIFKNALESVKLKNKNKKIKASRKILEKIEEEKKLKFEKRMNRVKIRTVVEYPPPWAQKKKKDNKNQKMMRKVKMTNYYIIDFDNKFFYNI